MNSGFYNVTRNSKKNERDIMEKLKMFQKKDAAGQLRPFMKPRYEEAMDLHARLMALKGVEVPAPRAHVPGPNGWMYGLGDGYGLAPQVNFNPPPANAPSKPLQYGKYNENGEFKVQGEKSQVPSSMNDPAIDNIRRFDLIRKRKEVIPFLEETSKKLPELYNPFTGVKYMPEEDPKPDIDKAYHILKDKLAKEIPRARALKRRTMKSKKLTG
jgi:hypothetical protein